MRWLPKLLMCVLVGTYAIAQDDTEDDESTTDEASVGESTSEYIEEITVRGERGDKNAMKMSMTITGFNEAMVDQLGINNNNDLEALVPGLQMGHKGMDSAKNEDDHIYIRGIGSQRTVHQFSDVAVATYVDGVYTDVQYGLEPSNMFDVERIEVARGPQGTTGGRTALAGAIHYFTKKPTDRWDMRFMSEVTDQVTQRHNVAFGGPIAKSNWSYRITTLRWTGDGAQKNHGIGDDYDAPDQTIFAPQLRYKDDTFDVNFRYNYTRDKGSPKTAVELFRRDTTTFCLEEGTAPDGSTVCINENPFYGAENESPSVVGCDFSDPMKEICEGDELENAIDYNTSGKYNNFARQFSFNAIVKLTENLSVRYDFGERSHREDSINDTDANSRVGGGINPATGQADPFYALDGKGGGSFTNQWNHIIRESTQTSHEISLVSHYGGPFEFVAGIFTAVGTDPYAFNSFSLDDPTFSTDAVCSNATIIAYYLPALDADSNGSISDSEIRRTGGDAYWSCPGLLPNHSNTGYVSPTSVNPMGKYLSYYGDVGWSSDGMYFNVEYQVDESWKVFGGLRHDVDEKYRDQEDLRYTNNWLGFTTDYWYFRNRNVDVAIEGVCDDCGYDILKNREWSATTGNVGVEFSPRENLMYYGRISKGYRPGGFSGGHEDHIASLARGGPEKLSFGEELLVNYEFGVKGLFMDDALQLQTSVFFNDFQKYWIEGNALVPQDERVPGESPFRGDFSTVPDTWIGGLEIEGAYRFNDELTIRGFYAYMDSHIGDFGTLYIYDPELEPTTITLTDMFGNTFSRDYSYINLDGNELPNQPKHKYSLTALWQPQYQFIQGKTTLLTTVTRTGKKHVDFANIERRMLPAYTRWDARAIWDSADGKWSVTMFAKNLLDQISVQSYHPLEAYYVGLSGTLTDERELGAQVLWQGF